MPFDIRELVKRKQKTAPEIVAKVVAALQVLHELHGDGDRDEAAGRALASIKKYLKLMKDWLFGDEGHEPTKDNVIALAQEVVKTDFLLLTAEDLPKLDFESRKDAAQVFGAIVRIRDQSDRCPGAIYVQQKPQILDILFEG